MGIASFSWGGAGKYEMEYPDVVNLEDKGDYYYADIVVKVDDIEIKTDRVYVTAKSHQEVSYKLSNLTIGKHEICIDVK